MKRAGICGVVLVLFAATAAWAAPVIEVGSHNLLPNTPNQPVPIYVTGGDQVGGVNFFAQLGNDVPLPYGTAAPGPKLSGVDLVIGTIFDGNFMGLTNAYDSYYPAPPQNLGWWLTVNSGDVSAAGLLATVFVDTTGFSSGTWPLVLQHDVWDNSTDFPVGPPTYKMDPTIHNGSITIVPEPSTLCLVTVAIAGALACLWRRCRRA